MPKKPNYSFEKRKKELDRKAKKEEKLRRRREGGPEHDGEDLSPDSDNADVGGGVPPAAE